MTNAAQVVFKHLLSELKGWATARQSKRPTLLPSTNQHWGRCGPDAASVARVTQAVETHVTSVSRCTLPFNTLVGSGNLCPWDNNSP